MRPPRLSPKALARPFRSQRVAWVSSQYAPLTPHCIATPHIQQLAELGEAAGYAKEKERERASHKASQVINPKQFWSLIDEYLAPPPSADPLAPPPHSGSGKARASVQSQPSATQPASAGEPSAAVDAAQAAQAAATVLHGPCPLYDRLLAALLPLPPPAPPATTAAPQASAGLAPAGSNGTAPACAPATVGAEAAASGEVKQEPGAEVKLEASVEVKQEASAAPAAPTAPAGGAGGVPPVVATPRELARAEAALRAKLVALGLVRGSEVALQEDPVVEELRRTMHRLRDVALRNARRRTLLHRRAQAEEASEKRRRLKQASAHRIQRRYQRRRQQLQPQVARPHKKRKTGAEGAHADGGGALMAAAGAAGATATGASGFGAAPAVDAGAAATEDASDARMGQDPLPPTQ